MEKVIINDSNAHLFINPLVDGERKSHGLIPRDYSAYPHGSLMHAKPFDIDLIPRSQWKDRLAFQKSTNSRLSNIRNIGMDGKPIPSRDQNGKGYSHSADTEVLTENGFVPWPKYNGTDLLASVNPRNHRIEFQAPTENHAYEYKKPMYYSTNRRLDFGVTYNHRMYVRKWNEQRRTLSSTYSFVPAESLGWYSGFLHAPSGFIGTQIDNLTVEDDRQYEGDDFIAMIALVCSDGYASGDGDSVSFSSFDPYYRNDVQAIAVRCGFTESSSKPGVWIRRSSALNAWVKANCYTNYQLGAQNKRIPELIKCASMEQIKHFIRFFGDKTHDPDKQQVFYSCSKRMIDDLQELHLYIGKRTSIGERTPRTPYLANGKEINQNFLQYSLWVGETDRLCIDRKKHIEVERYNDLVYCATVPNGTLITRRNGSILISGNCWAHSSTSACLLVRAIQDEPYADLSAYAVACMIKNFRDQGGWGAESLEFIAERGIPTSKTWPQQSMARSNDNPNTWVEAANYKVTEWMDLDPQNMEDQFFTCLLLGIPVVADYNWWGHSVCAIEINNIDVDSNGRINYRTLEGDIWNSWGDSWSQNGVGALQGRRFIPDSAIAPRAMLAA